MTEKRKIIFGTIAIILITGGTTYFIIQKDNPDNPNKAELAQIAASTNSGYAGSLKQTQQEGISLNETQQKQTSPSTLSVTNSQPNDSSLGTQQQSQQSQQTTTQTRTPTAPGPATFSQFDQYKDKDEVYYQDLVSGDGQAAESGKRVAVAYKGWLTNGTLFDQTKNNDKGELEPFVFELGAGKVIQGWELGVLGMKVGGTRRVIIPPSLGYGETGVSEAIPPNAVLVFDVQLLATE